MSLPYRLRAITVVNRAYSRDPLERVASIGGVNSDRTHWIFSQALAISLIEAGTDDFFFRVGERKVSLVVVKQDGEKYLQSEREKTHPDELFNLSSHAVHN